MQSRSTRRRFQAAMAGSLLTGCARMPGGDASSRSGPRLKARPGAATPLDPGVHHLKVQAERDALLYVPASVPADKSSPLIVFLHGAGGASDEGIDRLRGHADRLGFIVLSPASIGSTWDGIRGGYGRDVRSMDEALTRAFSARPIDPGRIAVSGFSDGASYALGLGLANGDLFGSVLAFSPGFIPGAADRTGKPKFFVSHGTNDSVLPIEHCSRRLVPHLKHLGYDVQYREFNGPHTVPDEIMESALQWFL